MSRSARILQFVSTALALALVGAPAAGGVVDPPAGAGKAVVQRAAIDPGDRSTGASGRIVREGIAVEFAIQALGAEAGASLVEGKDVEIRFTLTEVATGAPMKGLYPAGWVDRRRDGVAAVTCQKKIGFFVQGLFTARPEIDLNAWYVLTLNTTASIAVVDPLVDFSGQKLLAMVSLKSPGEDWALSGDTERLFVTLPMSDGVAVIDTTTWKVLSDIDIGPNPVRIAFQPDGKYVWVGIDVTDEIEGRTGGVTVIDAETLEIATQIRTGAGHHELAFSDDDRYVFVTNADAGTVSIIDIRSLAKVKDVESGPAPADIAYSGLARAAYVVDEASGTITVINGASHEVLTRIEAEPGIRTIAFAPGGRWGFVLNPVENTVSVIDASINRIVHSSAVGPGPDQLTFTEAYAYIRSAGSDQVSMIPLAQVGVTASLPMTLFSGGQTTPEQASIKAVANAIVATADRDAILIANTGDKTVYYYMEGMGAPMGSFTNFLREPKAVLVVDRSLRETAPGVYLTTLDLPSKGVYDVAFLLDTPRITHCFTVTVNVDPELRGPEGANYEIEFLLESRKVPAGKTTTLRFRVSDAATGKPKDALDDLRVLAVRAPGTWQRRIRAEPVGEGVYEVTLPVAGPGLYYIYLASRTLGKGYKELPRLVLYAEDKKPAKDAGNE